MEKTISLCYLGDEHDRFIVCRWSIALPDGITWKNLEAVRDRTDEKVTIAQTAKVWLKRDNPGVYPPKYELIISGRGEDGRCTWCRSFRTYLESYMRTLGCSINQSGECIFED